MAEEIILGVDTLGFPWATRDPFLFCAHHDDAYPAGNAQMGPDASLEGRQIGMDFEGRDGWRMYHGSVVPGFPRHPHRGFETISISRRGVVDHSDSLGAAARFGAGDVQWMTAGRGIVHAEMFPLLRADQPNPMEFFQIWLNLPRADKLVEPSFHVFWSDTVPRPTIRDDAGRSIEVSIVAGQLAEHRAPPPPPHSWAARAEAEVAIWTISLEPGARWALPAVAEGIDRTLYFFDGSTLRVAGEEVAVNRAVRLRAGVEVPLEVGEQRAELLLLQGRPIGERVAQYGPFVMNTPGEIQQAFVDYHRTEFGGWPWPNDAPVHPRERGRFARHADGKIEEPA